MESHRISRRHFFFGTLLAGAIPAGGFGRVQSLRRLGYRSPNEKLNIAAIGMGSRAEVNIPEVESESLVAFADPDSDRAANMFSWYEKVPRYGDFRRMFDKQEKDIDAVMITIPDHTHAVAAMYAMERGKHVYLEKPMTRTIWEARLLRDAAIRYKVATQMGTQGYSSEGERIAAEVIWSGEIGNVTELHAWTDRPIWPQGIEELPPEEKVPDTLDWDVWLGPAAARPYSPAYVPFKWRGWFDFGTGALGDIACHAFGVVNMALRLQAPISVEVVCQEGKNKLTFPKKSEIHFQFPARGAMPPVKIVWYDAMTGPAFRPPGLAANEPLISGADAFGAGGANFGAGVPDAPAAGASPGGRSRGQMRRDDPEASGAVLVGDKGMFTADEKAANIRLLPLSRHREYKLPPQFLSRSPGHYRDWIRACKGGEPPCSNLAVAGPFTEWVQLGALACHFEGKLLWDAAKMKVTNIAEANAYIKPGFRKGWELDSV